MRRLLQGTMLLVLIFLLGAFVFKPASPAAKRKAVVVELFTSEGCSSCPPADALLTRMGHGPSSNGAEVIPLGFHVDYWDFQGWRDRFSSHAFTERQEKYAARFHEGPYTPQLVVDGQAQLVGNDSSGAENAITQAAARQQQTDVQLSWETPEKLLVLATAADSAPSANVLLAVTEDDLASNVGAGENGEANSRDGHRLVNRTPHNAVYLEIGTRSRHERVEYPDVDLIAVRDEKGMRFTRKNGDPYA